MTSFAALTGSARTLTECVDRLVRRDHDRGEANLPGQHGGSRGTSTGLSSSPRSMPGGTRVTVSVRARSSREAVVMLHGRSIGPEPVEKEAPEAQIAPQQRAPIEPLQLPWDAKTRRKAKNSPLHLFVLCPAVLCWRWCVKGLSDPPAGRLLPRSLPVARQAKRAEGNKLKRVGRDHL